MEYNSLVLAYIGDAIYEVLVRKYLIDKNFVKVNDLQKHALNYVSAKNQALFLKELLDNENKILDVRSKVKEYVNNKYNWDKVSEDTEKAYKALKSK